MDMNRRSFLKGLLALGASTVFPAGQKLMAAESSPSPKNTPKAPQNPARTDGLRDKELLISSFFPMLVMNEKEVLYFYRDKNKNVTVGYGTNVQSNSAILSGVEIYHKNKKLTATEKKSFIDTMTSKSDAVLSDYTVSREDDKKMAKEKMDEFITELSSVFLNSATKKTAFFDIPLCMQALCLDIMYNVGVTGFSKFVKFKEAIRKRDYVKATDESKVYVNTKTKATNKNRERVKKRLIRVMNIVQNNQNKTPEQISALLKADYKKQVPLQVQITRGSMEQKCENSLAKGELTRIDLLKKRTLAKALPQKANGVAGR